MIRTGPPHSDTVDTRPVSDLCTCCCATSKDVSQQVVVWAQTRDRAAAMLAHVVVSIAKLDAIPTDRRCDRTWSWHHHRRRRPVLGSSEARQNDALWTRVLLAMVDLFVRRTQWVVLSAANEHPWCGASHAGPGRGVDGADGAIQPLAMVLSQPQRWNAHQNVRRYHHAAVKEKSLPAVPQLPAPYCQCVRHVPWRALRRASR